MSDLKPLPKERVQSKRVYKIQTPDGTIDEVINYQAYGKRVGIGQPKMRDLIEGLLPEYKGYKVLTTGIDFVDALREDVLSCTEEIEADLNLVKNMNQILLRMRKNMARNHEERAHAIAVIRAYQNKEKTRRVYDNKFTSENRSVKKIVAKDPEGQLHFFVRNAQLAKEIGGTGVDFQVHKLVSGKIDSYKGWSIVTTNHKGKKNDRQH